MVNIHQWVWLVAGIVLLQTNSCNQSANTHLEHNIETLKTSKYLWIRTHHISNFKKCGVSCCYTTMTMGLFTHSTISIFMMNMDQSVGRCSCWENLLSDIHISVYLPDISLHQCTAHTNITLGSTQQWDEELILNIWSFWAEHFQHQEVNVWVFIRKKSCALHQILSKWSHCCGKGLFPVSMAATLW